MTTYRHGDVNLHPTKEIKGEVTKHTGSFVLAEGEVTGHHHVLKVKDINDMTIHVDGGDHYITLRTEGTLVHPEHKPLTIPPGTYKQVGEREKDWFSGAVRRVID